MKTRAYAALSATTPLVPYCLDRREPGPDDVALEILYCGVCHSDVHSVRGEWPGIPSIAGSALGGVRETQEMLDFCAAHDLVADVEVIAMRDIETAYARMLKSDVKYRSVIDMASLQA